MRFQNLPELPISGRRASRFGFTLAELLVVIGVIALLAALLFPVLDRVKQGGQRTVCLNNLKQMGLAFQQYLADADSRYPGAGQFQKWGSGGHWVKGTNGTATMPADGADGALFLVSRPDERTAHVADVQGGALYPYVKSAKTYVCPSDPYGADDKNLSYSMNCAIAGMSNRSRMKNATDINLLVDEAYGNDGFFYIDNPVAPTPSGSTDAMAQYHLNSGNILFADGHVRAYTYTSYPLSQSNTAIKNRTTGAPRFWDLPFNNTPPAVPPAPPIGYFTSTGFGSCVAP